VGSEKFKSGTRLEFVCGQRALRASRALRDAVSGGVRLLSVLPEELPSAIEKLQAASKTQQKTHEALHERLATHEASALAEKGQKIGGVTLVAEALAGWDASGLKKLASAITSKPGMVAVLMTSESPSLVVVARSQDLALDTGAVLKTLLDRFGGKGGGKGSMAQGGGLSGATADILAAAREAATKESL
jgi:alanyl-tRNA synthetase